LRSTTHGNTTYRCLKSVLSTLDLGYDDVTMPWLRLRGSSTKRRIYVHVGSITRWCICKERVFKNTDLKPSPIPIAFCPTSTVKSYVSTPSVISTTDWKNLRPHLNLLQVNEVIHSCAADFQLKCIQHTFGSCRDSFPIARINEVAKLVHCDRFQRLNSLGNGRGGKFEVKSNQQKYRCGLFFVVVGHVWKQEGHRLYPCSHVWFQTRCIFLYPTRKLLAPWVVHRIQTRQ